MSSLCCRKEASIVLTFERRMKRRVGRQGPRRRRAPGARTRLELRATTSEQYCSLWRD